MTNSTSEGRFANHYYGSIVASEHSRVIQGNAFSTFSNVYFSDRKRRAEHYEVPGGPTKRMESSWAEVLRWLDPPATATFPWTPGTNTWFLDGPEIRSWKRDDASVIFLHGPGILAQRGAKLTPAR
jgi:hypothetical protein